MSRRRVHQALVAFVTVSAAAALALPGCKRADRSEPDPERAAATDTDTGAEVPFVRLATLGEAVDHIVARDAPLVIGFGEFHQTTGASQVRPTLERFTAELERLVRDTSDLIVETWVEEGRCGEQEEVVNRDVREVTERPPVVENQLMVLLLGAKERGVAPHVMTMRCADYDRILVDEEVDFEKMLALIKHKLAELAERVWQHRMKERVAAPDSTGAARRIAIYGGALHNDIHPAAGIEHFSYAADIRALIGDGRYVEIDLLVPEYIEGNPLVTSEPWYPSFLRHADAKSVLVFEKAPASYAVILRKGLAAEPLGSPD